MKRKFLLLSWAMFAGILFGNEIAFGQLSTTEGGNLQAGSLPKHIVTAGLGRGVNFGNMLEAPNEGDWGLFVEEIFFDKVVEAGLDHIRLPISWTHHAASTAPFTIEEQFFSRVDEVVNLAIQRGLKVIVNNHHYAELNQNPADEQPRALALWQQIATRYRSMPDTVFFEILNEPHGAFNNNPELWNSFMVQALGVIRQTNPSRKVLVGPVFYNSISSLENFNPPKDTNLVTTVHFYEPFEFTHQGATWVDPVPPVGVTWNGDMYGIAGGWQNWSWNSTVAATDAGMNITHTAGFAGFQVHNPQPIANGQELKFTVDQAMELVVSVNNQSTGASASYQVTTTAGANSYSIDISGFASSNSITNIFVQNNSPNPLPAYTLSEFELKANDQSIRLVETAAQRIVDSFQTAMRWGVDRKLPMHLGEFGAYNFGDMASRVRWTKTVRETAERFSMDWSYWELAAGFGFYDPVNENFRLPLLQALVPNFK